VVAEWRTIEYLLSSGASFLEPVTGITNCAIAYDLSYQRLSVEIPVFSEELPKSLPRSLNFRIGENGGVKRLLVSCDTRELFRSFYDFIHEILELVHAGTHLPNEAVDDAWSKWGLLIERQSALSREKQVGLIGELWFLQRIANEHGWQFALDSWHKTAVSEHDFCLRSTDIEVKTTTNELRTHMIGSLMQLEPSYGRDLYLLSIQITSASMMASDSFSLASSVEAIMNQIAKYPSNLDSFVQRLEQAGWQESHMNFYDSAFVMRSKSRLVSVDNGCPRVINTTLAGLTAEMRARIDSVSYRIDVTGLGFEDGETSYERVLLG
jgi:hypothetical protein